MDLKISNYELNQNLMEKEPELTKKEKATAQNLLKNYFIEKRLNLNTKYFMFLNNDRHDYTILSIKGKFNPDLMSKDLLSLCNERGKLKSVTRTKDYVGVEIWINNLVYYLFPYDAGVIEYWYDYLRY